jgi:hypothetical protein
MIAKPDYKQLNIVLQLSLVQKICKQKVAFCFSFVPGLTALKWKKFKLKGDTAASYEACVKIVQKK